ncbi:MAG: hypothetical protein OHK0012_11920 [Synechococcales cyanobacterium]
MDTTVQAALKTITRWTRRATVLATDTATQVGTTLVENGGVLLTRLTVVTGDSARVLWTGLRSQLTKGQKL